MKRLFMLAAVVYGHNILEASNQTTIDPNELHETCLEIEQDPHFRMVRNMLTQNYNHPVAQNWDVVRDMNFVFSHELSSSFKTTNQKHSGRCWIFGALNVLRSDLKKKAPIGEFEFSQSYLYFYDKAERANLFLEQIIETRDMPLNSEILRHLLNYPIQDGGDWHVFVDLVNKYGLVPKAIYPDTEACKYSAPFNKILSMRLIKDAYILRELFAKGASMEEVRKEKEKMLKEIYQILVVHMGSPPVTFDYCYYDKDKKFQQMKNLTPLSFRDLCLEHPLDDYVAIIHSPRPNETPYYRNYRISSSNFMVEGTDFIALNLPMAELKEIVKEMLLADTAVSFSADILSQSDRFSGLLDASLYEFDHLYQTNLSMTKGTRLQYRLSTPNHAMIFTGVHLEDDFPVRWKVENSWGADVGKEGFFVMNDNWFDEYVFKIIVPKKFLSEPLQELLAQPSVCLNPWDPLWDPTY